jgi:hypothetical protein
LLQNRRIPALESATTTILTCRRLSNVPAIGGDARAQQAFAFGYIKALIAAVSAEA